MKDKSNSEILKRILNLRLQHRYSQEYMAHQLSISQNAYSKLERGLTNLNLERLREIADIFGVSMRDLMGDLSELPRIGQRKPTEPACSPYFTSQNNFVVASSPPIADAAASRCAGFRVCSLIG